ncbi:MAG: putative phosphothreonine lyase domain-containing protein [Candidatus Hodarchaeota archaeon]
MRDKILKYQNKIALKFSDSPPSEVTEVYWIYTQRKQGFYPEHTDKGGKWLIFKPINEIDECWKKIRQAVEEGKLGGMAKVSTAKQSPLTENPKIKVICVYTYDSEDKNDIQRIRTALYELGIIWKIPYKTDRATLEGKYRVKGDVKISRYFE